MALQLLGQEGVVTSRTGKGTFVSFSTIQQQLQRLTSFSQEMEQRGLRPSSRVIRAQIIPAPAEIASVLGMSEGAPLALLERVRCADDQPLALEICHLNHAVCPGILDRHDFAHESLYGVLQGRYGIRLLKAEQTISARLPSSEEQRLLVIGPHDPVLGLLRTTYNELDQPIEHVISVYNGSAYQLRTRLNYDL
jgi:GntR family transcriptional regulator